MPLISNTTTLNSHLRLQRAACLAAKKQLTIQFLDEKKAAKMQNVGYGGEPGRETCVYSLGGVAFGWKHGAGGLSHSHLVGSGSDGRSRGGLELPTKHSQLRLPVRGSGPREELRQ